MHARLFIRCRLRAWRHSAARRFRRGGTGFIRGVANPSGRRRALLVHLPAAFARGGMDVRHQNRFQATEIARLLGERGCSVDVIEPGGRVPAPTVPYDVVVDLHPGMTTIPAREGAVRIAYITGSNPAFSTKAEESRIADAGMRGRRGLVTRRRVPEFSNDDLGACSAMFFIGSEANLDTYSGLRLPPVHWIRNFAYPTAPVTRERPDPASFLFLASGGQVHKGLDLLLEIFARRQEWTLHVCSNFHEEPDFCRAYRRELFGMRNILPHGFHRLDSAAFAAIARACSHIVLPSCSEANAGSVISGMAAGLVPLVSRECGFEDSEVRRLPDCSIAAIEEAIVQCARTDPAALAAAMDGARRLSEARYAPRHFTETVARALDATIGSRNDV